MLLDADLLIEKSLLVIDAAFTSGAKWMAPMFSGGHDSLCACYVASRHQKFDGRVHHIRTGIGSKATFAHVEKVCKEEGWELVVWESPFTYETFVRKFGFPGPGGHQWVYNRLKDRCVRKIVKGHKGVALVTGCRSQESIRRMGSVEPVKVGELSPKTGKWTCKNRIWTAPCHDWGAAEQKSVMDVFGLSRNPIKDSLLGMSGECFCGAFARPGELAVIREICPDVAEEIDRLKAIAKECGTPCHWGKKPRKRPKVDASGPLCHACDVRWEQANFLDDDWK